jgi:hypothetical protein
MIAITIIVLGIIFGSAAYNQHYYDKERSDKAKRMQSRIIEARKGYRHPGPNKRADRPY